MSKTVAFTGHRPAKLCGYNRDLYQSFIEDLVVYLSELYYRLDVTKFISGGAQGFDQLAFWAVHHMKHRNAWGAVKNCVYVPFKGQEKRWPVNSPFGQEDYQHMLQAASEVRYISEIDTASKAAAIKALFARNNAMIQDADIIVALYCGDDWRTAKGGTADTMRKALKAGKTLNHLKAALDDSGCLRIISQEAIERSAILSKN